MRLRRGYQGKRFRVEDLENECCYLLSADEFQIIRWLSEKRQKEQDEKDTAERGRDHSVP